VTGGACDAERTVDMVKRGALGMCRTVDFIPDKSIAVELWQGGRTYGCVGGVWVTWAGSIGLYGNRVWCPVRAADRRSHQISIRRTESGAHYI